MEPWEDMERLRALVLEMGLPRRETAFFGVRCPYCGKSDRITRLEPPEELQAPPPEYGRLWQRLGQGGNLVVCKFCWQLLRIGPDNGGASPVNGVS